MSEVYFPHTMHVRHAQGVVVKVIHKKLYYRQKGVVEGLHDQYTAVVRMLESGDKVKFDQARLETVIPAIGKMGSGSKYILDDGLGFQHPQA